MVVKSFPYLTGLSLKTKLSDFSTGAELCWNTALNTGAGGFEAYNSANIASYGIATSETGNTPGNYQWTIPAALPAVTSGYEYTAISYQIAGASLAVSDLPNEVWLSTFGWNGTKVSTIGAIPTSGGSVKQVIAISATSIPAGNTWALLGEVVLGSQDSSQISGEIDNSTAGSVRVKLSGRVVSGGTIKGLHGDTSLKEAVGHSGFYPIPAGNSQVFTTALPLGMYSILIYVQHDAASAGNVAFEGNLSAQ